jgi:hypothetical protein
LGADVFDRRDEPRRAKLIRAVVRPLARQVADPACPHQIVEGRSCLGVENRVERACRQIGKCYRRQTRAGPPQDVQGLIEHRLLIVPPAPFLI